MSERRKVRTTASTAAGECSGHQPTNISDIRWQRTFHDIVGIRETIGNKWSASIPETRAFSRPIANTSMRVPLCSVATRALTSPWPRICSMLSSQVDRQTNEATHGRPRFPHGVWTCLPQRGLAQRRKKETNPEGYPCLLPSFRYDVDPYPHLCRDDRRLSRRGYGSHGGQTSSNNERSFHGRASFYSSRSRSEIWSWSKDVRDKSYRKKWCGVVCESGEAWRSSV